MGWALHSGEAKPYNTSQSPETDTDHHRARRARGIPACLHSLWVTLAHGNGDSGEKGTQGKEDVRANCSREVTGLEPGSGQEGDKGMETTSSGIDTGVIYVFPTYQTPRQIKKKTSLLVSTLPPWTLPLDNPAPCRSRALPLLHGCPQLHPS